MVRPVRLIPAVALMALIFFLSAQPDLGSGLGTWDLYLRKAAHMVEFGLLFGLLCWAFDPPRPGLAAALAIAYAVSDEWHQSFVEGRTGTPVDVLIDACGVLVAALLVARSSRARWR